MTDKLTPTQTLLMWGLLAKQGIAKQADILPAPSAPDRKVLEAAKFVTVTKRARSLWLTLADKGWAWAADHLRDPLPPTQGTLHGMMLRLHDHLATHEEGLADFIGAAPEPEPVVPPAKTATVSLRTIKAAYVAVSGKKTGVRVLLSDLRDRLAAIPRGDLDEALRRAHLAGKIILMRLDNPADITPPVRAAQLDFKGLPLHLIWIET